ncbi:MAG: glutamate--tRNA ligase family protein [Candidatus Hodgkinia cicadicola]
MAPSPTGCPHLGNLVIGLYNMLFKLRYGAVVILRIEDTDTTRSSAINVNKIYSAFSSLGITFDESPVCVGKFGPYIQTQRWHIHNYYNEWLIGNDLVFWCECGWKRINALKQINSRLGIASVYDGRCLKRGLFKRAGSKLRLKVPRVGLFRNNKHLVRWHNCEMQPLWTVNGPTFYLASVVDDHLMRTSHVLRGRDWAPGLAKQFLLYVYLRFELPKFYHLPLLACSKGAKLSKRLCAGGVDACISLGILPKTVLIYLMSLITGVELFKLSEVVSRFNLNNVNKAHLRLNKNRLLALNKRVLARACLEPNLFKFVLRDKTHAALKLCSEKSTLLTDVYKQMAFVFCFNVRVPAWVGVHRCYAVLTVLINNYKRLRTWNKSSLAALHSLLCNKLGLSIRTLLILVYLFAFGTRDSISLYDSFVLLDKERIVSRLELALNKL